MKRTETEAHQHPGQHLPASAEAPANWLLQNSGSREVQSFVPPTPLLVPKKGPGLWILIPALPLAGCVTPASCFPFTGAEVSHLEDDVIGLDVKKGPGSLGHGDEANKAEPQNIFSPKRHFPFRNIDRNSKTFQLKLFLHLFFSID